MAAEKKHSIQFLYLEEIVAKSVPNGMRNHLRKRMDVQACGQNPGQGTVRSVQICVCILLGSSREETA